MEEYIKKRHASFSSAFAGLGWVIRTQPNYLLHLFISVIVIILGRYVDLPTSKWIIIILLIMLGLVVETVNTAIEVATDAIAQGQIRQDIKIAKDVSAAAMLVYAFGASIIAILIFSDYF